jgi:hypothetical protein
MNNSSLNRSSVSELMSLLFDGATGRRCRTMAVGILNTDPFPMKTTTITSCRGAVCVCVCVCGFVCVDAGEIGFFPVCGSQFCFTTVAALQPQRDWVLNGNETARQRSLLLCACSLLMEPRLCSLHLQRGRHTAQDLTSCLDDKRDSR